MITQELIAYVKSEVNKGRTREDIRASLLSGGGWTETDVSEVFRAVMPMENAAVLKPTEAAPAPALSPSFVRTEPAAPFTIQPSSIASAKENTSINLSAKAPGADVFPETKTLPRSGSHLATLIGVLILGLCAVAFYFYGPQILSLPGRVMNMFISSKKEEPVKQIPVVPAVVIPVPEVTVLDCGTTTTPDRKNTAAYLNDNVLKCLGESAHTCVTAKAVINDPLFPNSFKIISQNGACVFELSYGESTPLRDVNGRRLAGRGITCPVSVAKSIDETNPKRTVFKAASPDNPNKYAADIYIYGTLGVFIDKGFDQKKIEELGCSGPLISSMIESYNLIKSKF